MLTTEQRAALLGDAAMAACADEWRTALLEGNADHVGDALADLCGTACQVLGAPMHDESPLADAIVGDLSLALCGTHCVALLDGDTVAGRFDFDE